MRQGPSPASPYAASDGTSIASSSGVDTVISSLTFAFAPTPRELDTLVTREFNADPNLHRNRNVDLVGDYSTAGNLLEQFEWSWKWRAPKIVEDKGGGWRNTCSVGVQPLCKSIADPLSVCRVRSASTPPQSTGDLLVLGP